MIEDYYNFSDLTGATGTQIHLIDLGKQKAAQAAADLLQVAIKTMDNQSVSIETTLVPECLSIVVSAIGQSVLLDMKTLNLLSHMADGMTVDSLGDGSLCLSLVFSSSFIPVSATD